MPIGKTANTLWKEHNKATGSRISFSEFLEMQRTKVFNANGDNESILMVNKSLNDTVQAAIDKTLRQGGLKTQEDKSRIFGLPKIAVIGGGLVLTAAIIFLLINRKKA